MLLAYHITRRDRLHDRCPILVGSSIQSAGICLHMLGIDMSLSHRRSMTQRLLSTWFSQPVEAVARGVAAVHATATGSHR